MKKLQNLAINLGLTVSTLIFAVTVAEIGLRIAKIETPPPPREDSNQELLYTAKDPNRGWAGNPNATAFWQGEGIPSELKMNSGGFRDYERSKTQPENGLRIALLGDSFTEALHVKLEDTYGAIIEQRLQQCPVLKDRKVEVMNFGVQGYGTAQQLMTLRHHVWDYAPDLVILVFYAGNDLRNNYRALEHDHLRPYFVYKNGQLVEDMSFRDLKFWERDRYNFSIVDFLPFWSVQNYRILQLIRKVDIDAKRRQFEKDYSEINLAFYKEPQSNYDWEETWKVTEGLIKLMRDEVYDKGSDFMVITASDSYQVLPDIQKRDGFRKSLNVPNLFYPDIRLKNFGKEENIPVYNLAGPIWDEAKKTGKCLHGFDNAVPCGGHWNIAGHKFVGEIMGNYLCEQYTTRLSKEGKRETL
ncbi:MULTISPECIES: SGNH/GDSL hydrolase family protein [unclassified Okeania]|uniref:SGNH/GDSL hydrolase family protein n=2 Tax=Okeania TaxID=1458928 RepID=UPI0013B91389|nr:MULTISPECIES: SGNH/GDSL hydrolase family protein [unclassified Okeania]NES78720.1 SGNH/GDSL hydrolase family protein [Okeania sp. SIO1H4]NET23200.1 SGNH/GDSL hydrolase family protein [Okeania sp. SIO1H5]NET79931.1 SGNH/GDSL hydrolase family protein [Okeania sp. SIO1F9]